MIEIIFENKYNYTAKEKIKTKELSNFVKNYNTINIKFIDNNENKDKSRLYKRLVKLANTLSYQINPIRDFNDLGSIKEYKLTT